MLGRGYYTQGRGIIGLLFSFLTLRIRRVACLSLKGMQKCWHQSQDRTIYRGHMVAFMAYFLITHLNHEQVDKWG